jgi:hypothetical protein
MIFNRNQIKKSIRELNDVVSKKASQVIRRSGYGFWREPTNSLFNKFLNRLSKTYFFSEAGLY